MHYAVKLALDDGLDALAAGRIPRVPSGAVASLKTRRTDLEVALSKGKASLLLDEQDEALAELNRIERLLDALEIHWLKTGEGNA
jgi:hypothetical protein